jgi:hypothetical protein
LADDYGQSISAGTSTAGKNFPRPRQSSRFVLAGARAREIIFRRDVRPARRKLCDARAADGD